MLQSFFPSLPFPTRRFDDWHIYDAQPGSDLQLMVIRRPTSNNSGGLVLWVEGAAAASVFRHNLAGGALHEGEVVRFLRDTRQIHICLDEKQCRPTLGPYLVFTSDTLVLVARYGSLVWRDL